ncbi:hypothetical protein U1Q18_045210, partial [Sarracenia purpurea var. burkii]
TDHHAGSAFDHAIVNRATTASIGSPLPCAAVRHRLTPVTFSLSSPVTPHVSLSLSL